ncbi:MAG TPA: CDP-alcohol phosphatidyltransferase family protein [Syntrophorhabdales bacterium]|nr:CDP-alcohol phosphatidyltransferase family protein [Syntrophorhabdales bacterium]
MTKIALILARDERGLQPVFGLPAVRRLVLLTRQLGIEAVHIVSRQASIFAVLPDLILPEKFHIVSDLRDLDAVVRNMDICRGSRLLLARADHVVDRKSLAAFVQAIDSAEDRATDKNGIYAWSRDGLTRAETIYSAGEDALLPLLHAIWSPDQSDQSILDKAEQLRASRWLPDIVGRDDEPVRAAEDRLVGALPSATVHRDGFMARHLDRHLSRRASPILARTPVTPNGVTLFNVAVGLGAAFLLLRGGYWSQLVGTLLFLSCVVLDGVDGEVARLKLQETAFGHYLDIVTDNIVHLAIFIGLAVGLYRQTGDRLYLQLLWFLLGGFGFCAAAIYKVSSAGPDKPRSRVVDRLTGLLGNRDFAYLLVALAIIGRLNWFVVGAAAGSYIFAAVVLAFGLRWRRSSVSK